MCKSYFLNWIISRMYIIYLITNSLYAVVTDEIVNVYYKNDIVRLLVK